MIGRLNHVAIAVPDLEAAVATYRDTLGATVSAPQDEPDHGVTVVFVELPNTKVELLHPLGEGWSWTEDGGQKQRNQKTEGAWHVRFRWRMPGWKARYHWYRSRFGKDPPRAEFHANTMPNPGSCANLPA
jgi:catechol 2,3-dioxygenase-like lactoylglutathione lyase family enzyme